MGCCSSKTATTKRDLQQAQDAHNAPVPITGSAPVTEQSMTQLRILERNQQGNTNTAVVFEGQLIKNGGVQPQSEGAIQMLRDKDSLLIHDSKKYSQGGVTSQFTLLPVSEKLGEGSGLKGGMISEESKVRVSGIPKKKKPVFFDLNPTSDSLTRKQQIYQASNGSTPSITKPFTTSKEWQEVILKHQSFTSEEELVSSILAFRNRNWILEQVKLTTEFNFMSPMSFDSVSLSGKILQLKEHFNWFVWALAQFYFFFNGSSSHYQAFQPGSHLSQAQSEADVSINSSAAGGGQRTTTTGGTASANPVSRTLLPKVGSKTWSDGFEFKGIYIKVLPYEDSHFVRNELKALKYAQLELLELRQLCQSFSDHSSEPSSSELRLQQQILLPLITGVYCGGFYLYATPIIYIPKTLDQKLNTEFPHVRDMIKTATTPQSLGYSPSPQPPENYDIDSQARSNAIKESSIIQNSMLSQMPFLKNVTQSNLVPVYDYDSVKQKNTEPQIYYIMLNLYDAIPRVKLSADNQISTFRIPNSLNDEITFHTLPSQADGTKSNQLEVRELRKFIQYGVIGLDKPVSTLPSKKNLDLLINLKNMDGIDESDIDLQADEYQNFLAQDLEMEDRDWNKRDDDTKILDLYQKRSFTKHGWEFMMVSRRLNNPGLIQQTLTNDNKRATNLFGSRETQLRNYGGDAPKSLKVGLQVSNHKKTQSQQFEISPVKIPIEEQQANLDQTFDYSSQQHHNLPLHNPFIAQTRYGLFFRQEGTQTMGGGLQTGLYESTSQDPTQSQGGIKVFGSALVSAQNFTKELKLKYCLNNLTFSTSIESILSASLDQAVQVIEQSDKIYSQLSLKELMHRKGLNMRFAWLILVKQRFHKTRYLVMIDILMRVMRKIVNEEVKIKSIAIQPTAFKPEQSQPGLLSGRAVTSQIEEYYQGGGIGSVDTYKEMLTFYINTLLKRKMHKYRSVFEETILGLFLSRMQIHPFAHSLNLKKEEFNYLESKDILEDILEAPSKNPAMFINAVSTYFNIEFKQDFLRVLRQDKYVFLAKTQPVGKNDIKPITCRTNVESYFSLKEESYFLLANLIASSQNYNQPPGPRATTNAHNLSSNIKRSGKTGSRIKTKTDKDKIVTGGGSHRRPLPNSSPDQLMASARESLRRDEYERNEESQRSMIRSVSSSMMVESNDALNQSSRNYHNATSQNVNQVVSGNQQESKTHRQKEVVVHDFRQPKDSISTIRQYQNMEAIINEPPMFAQLGIDGTDFGESTVKLSTGHLTQINDFSKFSKRNNFQPQQGSELVLPSVLYKLKTHFSNNSMHNFEDGSKPLGSVTVLKAYYEMPSLDIIEKWKIVMDSLLKDICGVNGSEQVLIEALTYNALMIFFFKNGGDSDEFFKVLMQIREALFNVSFCAPETIALIQILTGMFFEEKKDQVVQIEAEKSYLTAMICAFQLYGDPRGRGNITMPYSLFLSWKLSLLSLAEDKKLHDSEFAEELFDATLSCLTNHKLVFKEQQLQQFYGNVNLRGGHNRTSPPFNNSSLPTEQMGTLPEQEKSKFDLEMEANEMLKLKFDIKKYKTKPFNITYASGIHRQIAPVKAKHLNQQAAMNVYVTVNHHYNNNKELKGIAFKNDRISSDMNIMSSDFLKSRSQVLTGLKKRKEKEGEEETTTQLKQEYDLEPSDIDIEVEDDNKQFFIDENFTASEYSIGECPFQHWSLYRQKIMQILQAHNLGRNRDAQLQYQKQVYKEMVHKILPKEQFYGWLLRYNPMMYQSGTQWSNALIKDFIFCQNQQQMVNSSSSSVVMSHHNLSNHSLSNSGMSLSGEGMGGSSAQASGKDKRHVHLGSYSQILGKEVGGISKQDMHGILFTMGTDAYGQLGLEAITSQIRETHSISLKVLYPRMIIALRDEMIKEVCCGHCHTMAINVHGQVFAWGLNESGQLGLGPDAPAIVRKPLLNPYLSNVTRLSAGNEHSLAMTKSGDLYVWGGGGLTGLNDVNIRPIPTKMEFFQQIGAKIHQAVCGGLHTVVVTKEGEAYSWGSTEGGQLGLSQELILQLCDGKEQPVLTPQRIPKLQGVQITQVACGEAHSIAIGKDGKLYGWGMSNYGQLGLGFSSDSFEPGVGMEKSKVHEPEEITHLKGEQRISKIICGATFSLFQTDKGDLFGCGMNDLGQLGLDTYMEDLLQMNGNGGQGLDKVKRGRHQQASTDVTVPTKVICFQGIALHNIACGENHALAVSGDDRNMLWAWGMYRQGQLGLGEVTTKMNPRPVQTLCSSSIHRIGCGSMHSVALIGDPQHVSNLSSQYYAGSNNFDAFQNYWSMDLRGLGIPRQTILENRQFQEVDDMLQFSQNQVQFEGGRLLQKISTKK